MQTSACSELAQVTFCFQNLYSLIHYKIIFMAVLWSQRINVVCSTHSMSCFDLIILTLLNADPSGCTVWGVGLWPPACWDCGFEPHQGHGCLSVMSVVCCQVEVSATGWSLVQRSPTKCGVSESDHESLKMRRPWPTGGLLWHGKKKKAILTL